MGNSCSPGCRWWCLCWRLFVLSFFPQDVLDEIWDIIESVSWGFLTYSDITEYLVSSVCLYKFHIFFISVLLRQFLSPAGSHRNGKKVHN